MVCISGKKAYKEKAAIKAAIKFGKRKKAYVHHYCCNSCGDWHISSMRTATDYTKLKKAYKRNKKWKNQPHTN